MNIGRVLISELRKLFHPAVVQPVPVRARKWVDRTRCW
jgi:hypothetical protein